MDNLTIDLIWVGSAIIGGILIYFKQGKFLTEQQPVAFVICGPITLLIGIFVPSRWLTSRGKSEGKDGN